MFVAQLGSLSAASRKLGKDLGNLSKTLAKLERLHGEALFIRHQSGLKLTATGIELYRALLQSNDAFTSALVSPTRTNIRIGFSPPVGFGFFGETFLPLLTPLNLNPQFLMASSLELYELLKRREIDFILTPRSPKFPDIISSPFFTTRLVLVSKSGKSAPKLIRSQQLFDLEKRLSGLNFEETLILDDYFVSAKLLEASDEHMAILPECILSNFPELKKIPHRFDDEKIFAITWKGSPGVDLLRKAKELINNAKYK